MYLKIILKSFLILFLIVIQLSFISALPAYFSNINIVLISLVYLLMITDLSSTINYAIALGILMDAFSFNIFGSYLFSFLLSIVLANFLLEHFFTNRSLYAFVALILSATLFNFLFLSLINIVYSVFIGMSMLSFNENYFRYVFSQLVLNSFFMVVVFYLTNFLSNTFRPVFLVNKKR